MTTLVALNTRDALVMGCDSLGTVTRMLVDPFELLEYFEPDSEYKPKLGPDGQPVLDDFLKIYAKSQLVPYDQMTHVDKLFSLKPLEMGVMFAGEVAIGDSTVKNLIAKFKSEEDAFKGKTTNYTLKSIGRKLLRLMWDDYRAEYPDERRRPELELMLCGYDKRKRTPGVVRISVHKNEIGTTDYDFGVYFGGQTGEIQRLVHGTDVGNKLRLIVRTAYLLKEYHTLLCQQLQQKGIQFELQAPEEFGEQLWLFNNWNLEGLDARWAAFSEQNAIDCIDFLVNIMVRSHQFCSKMPTVGGEVQIAVIKKESGFTAVSRKEWRHGDYAVPAQE